MITVSNQAPKENLVYYTDNISLEATSYIELSKQYLITELSLKEKKQLILDSFNLSESEFQVVAAVVASEANNTSYKDSYAVINTIYNRTKSKRWVNHVNNLYGKNKGYSLYYQVITPNQFTVYSGGSYKKYLNNIPKKTEKAIIDFLYSEEPLHNYLSFRSSSSKGANAVQFVSGGNKYYSELTVEDKL